MSGIEIRPARFGGAVARRLVTELMADLAQRYGGVGDATPTSAMEFDPPDGGFLVAFLEGAPVGCGGWRSFAGSEEIAEVKRVFTVESARGRGVAREIMAALEADAKAHGRIRVILETGAAQPEAIALYENLGYQRIENFGHYRDEPDCRSYGKDI